MKKSIIFHSVLIAVIVFFASLGCDSKDDDMNPDDTNNSGYFLKAKVDGKLVEFKTETLLSAAIGSSMPGVYDLALSGGRQVSGQSALAEVITIILRETSPITEKTYTELSQGETGLNGVLLGYGLEIEDKAYITNLTDSKVNLEITEMKQTSIKGKFSGVVKDFISGESKTITEGAFFIILKSGNDL